MSINKIKLSKGNKFAIGIAVIIVVLSTSMFITLRDDYEYLSLVLLISLHLLLLLILIHSIVENSRIASSLNRAESRLTKEIKRVERTAATSQINSLLDLKQPLIWEDTYMIAPSVLLVAMERLLDKPNQLIVECGAGISSVVLGYIIKQNGSGKVISLEHDEEYVPLAKKRIARRGLSDYVEIIHAPLKEYSFHSKTWLWYDTGCFFPMLKAQIDFVLVDGPPGNIQYMSRYPALPLLIDHLSDHCTLLIDDFARTDEKEMARKWMDEFSGFKLTNYRYTEKGAAIMQRQMT